MSLAQANYHHPRATDKGSPTNLIYSLAQTDSPNFKRIPWSGRTTRVFMAEITTGMKLSDQTQTAGNVNEPSDVYLDFFLW